MNDIFRHIQSEVTVEQLGKNIYQAVGKFETGFLLEAEDKDGLIIHPANLQECKSLLPEQLGILYVTDSSPRSILIPIFLMGALWLSDIT